jgi:cobalt-zinc-cadmium efflux system outer membrane protein
VKAGACLALVALLLLGRDAGADEGCQGPVSRATLVPCALRAGLGLASERQAGEAAEARVVAASPWLPSNPTLALTASRRSAATENPAFNWSGTLSQEFDLGGQRGARRRAAESEREAQRQRGEGAARELAAQAWGAYFEALAARDDRSLSVELERVAAGVAAAARAMSDRGLIAPLDADVAAAAGVRQRQARFAADRRLTTALAQLAHLVGADPMAEGLSVEGELEPIAGVEAAGRAAASGPQDAPEVRALEAEGRALGARADGFRRARVPGLTLSLFVQNDGFGERVYGLGVGLPLPLPHPVGRSYAGEIAEAEALGRRASTEAERLRRLRRLDVAVALRAFASHRDEVEAFTPEQTERAEKSLRSIEQEVRGGRLALRDAILAQQSLVELRRARIEARRALCLASLQLARAAGLPLERSGP